MTETWKPAQNADTLEKQTHALEHIAACVDSIEKYSSRIADALTANATANAEIAIQLAKIGDLLSDRLGKR